MKNLKIFTLGLCLVMAIASCNNTQKGMGIGAGGGAAVGAIVGALIGHNGTGALIGAAVGGAVGTGAGYLIGKHMDKVAAEAIQIQNAKVEKVKDANGLDAVKVSFDSGLLFQTGKSDLNATVKSNLNQLAGVLGQNKDCDVAIYGHTDNTGFGKKYTAEENAAKNQALSEERANSVKAYLKQCGVQDAQVKSTQGFGQTQPVADNSTDEGRQLNRRVEVYLYASAGMIKSAEAGTLK